MASRRFQQSDFWAAFKCAHDWHNIKEDGINILYRIFKVGPFTCSIAYIPMAPEAELPAAGGEAERRAAEAAYLQRLGAVAERVRRQLPRNTLCVRFDVPLDFATVEARDAYIARVPELARIAGVDIGKTDVDVQPPDSVVIDLTQGEEAILSAMKSKWRYNVRYAMKHDVAVRTVRAGDATFGRDLDSFYALYRTTAERDGIGIHPQEYYRDLMERGANDETTRITLYIASHGGDDLAAIITLFSKDEAVYLYGCSANEKRNLMPAYLVQWTAICDARRYGSKIYDFYGIPPTDDENHPMHGLYLFKTGFGGREVHRPGSFDIPVSPLYSCYTAAENLRAWYHKKFLKRLRGR